MFVVGLGVVVVASVAVSTTPALAKGTSGTGQPGDFSQVVRAMRDRVKEDGLTGGRRGVGAGRRRRDAERGA